MPKELPKKNLTESIISERPEEIPSFSEWTQKQLEEAERKKELVNNSAQGQNWNSKPNSSLKVRSKNYASPDCGAKIVAANPEAQSVSAVLSPSKDEYNLNTCTSRIWFVVELCEAIQAKKIDIANFELFSSSPKDFTVSLSDRFPSRDWSIVGQFTAKDVKDVQSFELDPHLFGKYIKVEIHSHYGSEHYCPVSLFRVYGTSEFEVLEKEDEPHSNVEDDDDDELLGSESGTPSSNLFSSATDAVISIVKKAAEVLGNKGNASNQTNSEGSLKNNKYSPLMSSCTTPSHLVICNNCSDDLFGYVFELLSCKSKALAELISVPLIRKTIYNTDICAEFGLDFQSSEHILPPIYISYIKSIFNIKYIAALCNTAAILENKVLLNISKQFPNATVKIQLTDPDKIIQIESGESPIIDCIQPAQDVGKIFNTNSDLELTLKKEEEIAQIKPTKTLQESQDLNETKSPTVPQNIDEVQNMESVLMEGNAKGNTSEKVSGEQSLENLEGSAEQIQEFETTTESSEGIDEHMNLDENVISELNNDSNPNVLTSTTSKTVVSGGPKESVFLRLSNRIKVIIVALVYY